MSELLRVENLTKSFPLTGGLFDREIGSVQAVRGVSFSLNQGETLGLVGESGCGKSTLGRCLLRLIEPTSGQIIFKGQDITSLKGEDLRFLRRKIQIVFQDPFASLNPRMTIGSILEEPLIVHGLHGNEKTRKIRVQELLSLVGLRPESIDRYPHEFSGGQRQRVGIARALAVEPDLIILDEPVSALDVSIQAQVINLLMDLQKQLGLTYIFIAHDLKVVEHVSTQIAVMYLGRIVEKAPSDRLYLNPSHPYTEALLSAIPIPNPEKRGKRLILTGDVPSPMNPPPGCPFHPRCPVAFDLCRKQEPTLDLCSPGHYVSCLKVQKNNKEIHHLG
jgi:oligopeptide transport system ATP-binding protein